MKDQVRKLLEWQSKYDAAVQAYEPVREQMKTNQDQYDGRLKPKEGAETKCIYNFTKELIESVIDPNVPLPRVEPTIKNEINIKRARMIEAMLMNEVKRINFEEFNDVDERTTKIMGGNIALIEWNNSIKTHYTVGDIDIRRISPMRFTPQNKIYEIEKMDYVFLDFEDTKENIKKIYGVDVDAESIDVERTDDDENNETVTQVWAFFKNSSGGVGVFSWVGSTIIIDDEEYQARAQEICTKCGLPRPAGENKCSCGNDKWELRHLKYEEVSEDIETAFGIIPAEDWARDDYGNILNREVQVPVTEFNPVTGIEEPVYEAEFDDMQNLIGEHIMTRPESQPYKEQTKLPYYIPRRYPVCLRKNISAADKIISDSDAEAIYELQDMANKIATKLISKVFSNGQLLTKLKTTNLTFSNDLQVAEFDTIDEIHAIRTLDLKFDSASDINLINQLYMYAKSLLGVNDSAQGKQDTTATSGRAKEAQISRAAARQSSKMVMKESFYQNIYYSMMEYALAYMDEPRNYPYKSETGEEEDVVFSRYDFLDRDKFGNWFYNDQFIITIDQTGSVAENRQACLEAMQEDFTAGLYGSPDDPETILTFWRDRESMNYPNAKRQVARWTKKVEEYKQMQQIQTMNQEVQNEMPQL